jgi:sugar transferase (PEP-CTERM system associated)
MHMPIATINDTTWAEVSTAPRRLSLRVRRYSVARSRGAFLAAEVALICAVVLAAVWMGATFEAPILVGFCALGLYLKALDRSIVHSNTAEFSSDLSEALCWGTAAGMLLLYIVPALGSRTEAAVAGVVLAGLLPVVLRPVLRQLVNHQRLVEGTLIVGSGELAEKLHQALATGEATSEYERSSGMLRFPDTLSESAGVTDFSRLHEILDRDRISRVIVAEQDAQNRARLAATLVAPRMCGLLVNDAADFYEQFFGKIWSPVLSSEWFVYTNGFTQTKISNLVKRCLDVVFALVLLLVAAPVLLLIAIAIKLDSAGPALFRQVRVGLRGKTFVIYKFRSMRQDAEDDGGPAWATECDARVTRVGRLLRRFRLDEIPQAINVLRGEMSLVGPRPERPFFVDRLTREIPFYSLRHYVKPGITGWAQVRYRYGASVEDACEKLRYDLYYAKHRSCLCDTEILLRTVEIVLFGRGR